MNSKLEMTIKVEHADMYQNEKGELMLHILGLDEADLNDALNEFHKVMAAREQEAQAQQAAEAGTSLTEQSKG